MKGRKESILRTEQPFHGRGNTTDLGRLKAGGGLESSEFNGCSGPQSWAVAMCTHSRHSASTGGAREQKD